MHTAAGHPRHALVVAHDRTVRDAFAAWLSNAGLDVAVAGGAEGALSLIASRDFAAIVIDHDIRSTTGNGLDIVRTLRGSGRRDPVLYISGAATDRLWKLARAAGADACLARPCEAGTFVRVVHALSGRPTRADLETSARRFADASPVVDALIADAAVVVAPDSLAPFTASLARTMVDADLPLLVYIGCVRAFRSVVIRSSDIDAQREEARRHLERAREIGALPLDSVAAEAIAMLERATPTCLHLSEATLCAALGTRRALLWRLFSARDATFIECRKAIVMRHAAQRIAADGAGVKITSIARETGYTDESHFTRAFKTFFFCSPSRYRALVAELA